MRQRQEAFRVLRPRTERGRLRRSYTKLLEKALGRDTWSPCERAVSFLYEMREICDVHFLHRHRALTRLRGDANRACGSGAAGREAGEF